MRKGEKRIWVNADMHDSHPEYYPKVGTIGKAIGDNVGKIQWPAGSTSYNDCWAGEFGSEPYVPWWKRLFMKIGGKA